MADPAARRPVHWPWAWPAVAAAVLTFAVTVVVPPVGFLGGLVALVVLGFALRRRRQGPAVAVATAVVAAVLGYLALGLVGAISDAGPTGSDVS